jgi:hypothetical protein
VEPDHRLCLARGEVDDQAESTGDANEGIGGIGEHVEDVLGVGGL